MWQQSEIELRAGGGASRSENPWPCAQVLKSLAESNEQCLELLAAQALQNAPGAPPILRDLGELWGRLDEPARRRAAECPYFMLDAGFADPYRWRWVGGQRIAEEKPVGDTAFFSLPEATDVARQVFNNAWHIVQTHPVGAALYLGMPAHCAAALRACSMRQITQLADAHADWLRPRWPNRPKVWRGLLTAAISADAVALQKAQMHGVQLLATELRALDQVHVTDRR